MKRVYYLFLVLFLTSCMSSKPVILTYKSYTVEKELPSKLLKNDLYTAANIWMVETFNSATNVIQFSDKEGGVIIGRYLMGGPYSPPQIDNRVYAIITIKVKDNLTKIRISPEGEAKYYPPNPDDNIKFGPSVLSPEQVKSLIASTIDDYYSYIINFKKW